MGRHAIRPYKEGVRSLESRRVWGWDWTAPTVPESTGMRCAIFHTLSVALVLLCHPRNRQMASVEADCNDINCEGPLFRATF